MFYLYVSAPGMAARKVSLDRPVTTIGRSSMNDLPVSDKMLSRQHARIVRDNDGGLTVEDLGSRNGTFLNGERLTMVQPLKPGDRITVFSSSVGGNLELGVVDTGEGVAPEDRERIFDRFGRGGSARRTRADGAGLGLAIASAIAAAHGGRVELRDTPGGGATFVLVLPLTETVEEPTWPAS